MNNSKQLCDLCPGERGRVLYFDSGRDSGIKRRLLDIGLICGTEVECVGKSPCGDPKAYNIRGAIIAIRNEDCEEIPIIPLASGNKPWD